MMDSKDGIIGLVVGDAMGVPLEFCIREKLMQSPTMIMLGYRSHNVPKGCWSDDSSMTLATIDSIIDKKTVDISDMADKFVQWYREAKYTPQNRTFGIGRTTLRALANIWVRVNQSRMEKRNYKI